MAPLELGSGFEVCGYIQFSLLYSTLGGAMMAGLVVVGTLDIGDLIHRDRSLAILGC